MSSSNLFRLKKDAVVEVDDKKRIEKYVATDGSLELNGDHSQSAKRRNASFELKQCIRSLVVDYFENKNNSNAVPKNEEEKEMGSLIEFISEKCHNASSPLRIRQLVKDFQKHYEISRPLENIRLRVGRYCREIHRIEFLDTHTKVKQLFCLSTTVDSEYLEELRENALVEVDKNNRITHYKANDGSLELRGDHSHSAKTRIAKQESKGSLRSMINSYFNNKTIDDAYAKNEVEKEMGNLIEFISEKCKNANSPLSIGQLIKDFNKHFGTSIPSATFRTRIKSYCYEIQKTEFLDTHSKVKQLFGLSEKLDPNFLEELRKDAVVEVDDLNKITKYTANNGSLTLHGDHSSSAKNRTAQLSSKRSHRSFINKYFEKKKDAVPENEEEKEMWNFIEFIGEKCENVNSPLSIRQLTKDFNKHFGIARSLDVIYSRVKGYCREIQNIDLMDTHSKVRQLVGLSATLESNFLKELRKDANVEVDNLNRITKYTANNGRLILHGDHSRSAKNRSSWIQRKKSKMTVKKHCIFGDDEDEEIEIEDGYSEDDSDEYSSEEFGNEFNLDDDNDPLGEAEGFMGLLNETNHFDNEIPIRNRSEMSTYDSFDFDSTIERSHRSEETEKREDDGGKKTDNKNPKRKNSTPTAPASEKKRNKRSTAFGSPKRIGWFPNSSMWPNELDDYDTNYSIGDQVKLEPFRGSIQEDLNEFKEDEGIQQIPKPPQAHDEHDQIEEVTIKMENEEPVETKPKTSHSSKIKFFEAMQSLIFFLNTPSLSWIQSKIHQKIQNIEGQNEVVLNNEIVLTIELLIAQLTDHSVVNLSNNVESVNLSSLLCYLNAAILNSKLSGVDVLVKNINELVEESHVKRISMEKVANALRAILDIDCF